VADLGKSADKIGGEPGDILYAQVAWGERGFSSQKNIFEENTNLSWERVDAAAVRLEKKFPDSLEAIHMHGHLGRPGRRRQDGQEIPDEDGRQSYVVGLDSKVEVH